jgi:hypothetical protein
MATRRAVGVRGGRGTLLGALLLGLLLSVLGCGRSSTGSEHQDPAQLELRNRATEALLAHTEGIGAGQQWVGAIPALGIGETLAVNTLFRDDDGDLIALGGEYTANAVLATGSSGGIVELTGRPDHVEIRGIGAGTVQVIFQIFHGNHSDWNAPPIQITVEGN